MTPYYEQDGITIYHADCADILPTIDPTTVDLLLTDPPYGVQTVTDNSSRSRRSIGRQFPLILGDESPFHPGHLLGFSRCVLFGANNFAHHLPSSASWVVWNRLSGSSNTADAELAWSNLGGTVRMFTHLWNGVLRDSEIGWHVHPTQKPVALMTWILNKWTEPGDLILDPYMGSGPIAQACHELGRRYIGIEIEEKYCQIAVDRLAQQVLPLESS